MEQTKALNALEPFLALTKSATSPRAAVDLITRATSAPNTFIFTELLVSPTIQALYKTPEHLHYLVLLEIFCYGTYGTYKSTPNLPILNPAQKLKLQQLSLLSLAQSPTNLTYENLMRELDISSTRDLENLVISAIYAGLLTGTLDPHHQRVSISSVSPLRDVSPSSIPSLISTLKEWSQRCHSTLSTLENQIAKIRADAARRHKEEKEWNANVEKLIEKEGSAAAKDTAGVIIGGKGQKGGGSGMGRKGGEKRGFFGGSGGKSGGGGEGEMDIDEEEEEGEDGRDGGARSQKKRGLGGVSLNFGR